MENIVAKNIKKIVLNIFYAKNIFMDNKYIFVPYDRRFDANIF